MPVSTHFWLPLTVMFVLVLVAALAANSGAKAVARLTQHNGKTAKATALTIEQANFIGRTTISSHNITTCLR
jgi:hypothetical protein